MHGLRSRVLLLAEGVRGGGLSPGLIRSVGRARGRVGGYDTQELGTKGIERCRGLGLVGVLVIRGRNLARRNRARYLLGKFLGGSRVQGPDPRVIGMQSPAHRWSI